MPIAPLILAGLGMPATTPKMSTPQLDFIRNHPLCIDADVLIGGTKQLALFSDHPAEKIPITSSLPPILDAMKKNRDLGKTQVVLCSGDPLFFGLGARVIDHFGRDNVTVLPAISSLQAAAACIGISWEQCIGVSLHGRSQWLPLAHALSSGKPIVILNDANSAAQTVARYLTERGYASYTLHLLENIGYDPATGVLRAENQQRFALADISILPTTVAPHKQQVLVLEPHGPAIAQQTPHTTAFGIPDTFFAKKSTLFTKAPIRAAGLSALAIAPEHIVWDIGAGSGAMSIEAALLAYKGQVFAFEKDPERIARIADNRRTLRIAHLEIIQAAMPQPMPHLPRPHRIFVGGGLGANQTTASTLLNFLWNALESGGKLVVHCVLLGSLEQARACLHQLSSSVTVSQIQVSESTPLAGDMRLQPLAPVFLVTAAK